LYFRQSQDIIETYSNNYSAINISEGQDWGPSAVKFGKSKKFFCDSRSEPIVFFDSLEDHLDFVFGRWKDIPNSLKLQNTVTDIAKFVVITTKSDYKAGEDTYKSLAGSQPPTTYSDGLKDIENIVKTSIDVYNSNLR